MIQGQVFEHVPEIERIPRMGEHSLGDQVFRENLAYASPADDVRGPMVITRIACPESATSKPSASMSL